MARGSFKLGIKIIDVIIRENNRLQNFGNVNVATSHKIFYARRDAKKVYAQSSFICALRFIIFFIIHEC